MQGSDVTQKLREQLDDLAAKAEWEGGLPELILNVGADDMFPTSCRKYVTALQEAYEGLQRELNRLATFCGGEADW